MIAHRIALVAAALAASALGGLAVSIGARADSTDQTASVRALRPTPLEMTVAGSVLSRRLDYQRARPGGVRPYDLGGAPALHAEIRWFPAAYFTQVALAHLGFEARFEQAFALESALGTRRFATQSSETSLGRCVGSQGRWSRWSRSLRRDPLMHTLG
jgi:hypothetical protein